MVKRLRRRPLTAKTGVRVPVGLPKKEHRQSPVFFFWYFRRKRNPQGFARAQRRSTEGAPSGFRSIPRLSLLNLYFFTGKVLCSFFFSFLVSETRRGSRERLCYRPLTLFALLYALFDRMTPKYRYRPQNEQANSRYNSQSAK